MDSATPQVIAEVAVEPIASGAEHHDLIAAAIGATQDPALRVEVGALSTTLSGRLDDVLHAVQRAHQVAAERAERVVTTVRIESRRDGLDLESRDAEAQQLQREGASGG